MTIHCNQAQPLVWSYLDGELSEAQAQPLRQHLLDCASCRNSVSDGKALRRWFGPREEVAVPSGFAARVTRRAFAARHAQREEHALRDEAASDVAPVPAARDERSLRFVLQVTAIAASLLLVLAVALRFQSLPESDRMRADDSTQMSHEEVEKLLQRLDQGTSPAATSTGSTSRP